MDTFLNIIRKAGETAVGKIRYKSKRTKNVPWWNEKCKEARQKKNHAFNQLKKHNTIENRIEYKKLRAISRRINKENKTKSFQSYVASITHQTPINEVYKKINAISGRVSRSGVNEIYDINKLKVTEPIEIANIIGECFANNSSNKNYTTLFNKVKSETEENDNYNVSEDLNNEEYNNLSHNAIICLQELKEAIQNSKGNSVGPDDIPYIFLKNLPAKGILHLLKLMNIIWTKGTFPSIWKSAIIIPIPKPGKNHKNAENFRPIALTCTMCKVLEKVVTKRLRFVLEEKEFLTPFQSGFRPHHSSMDPLIYLQTNICEAFANNQHIGAIFLDIEKAFDMTWRYRIIKILKETGIRGNLLLFISNFLKDRTIKVKIKQHFSKTFEIENGTPQGSVISALLFIIAINDVVKRI